MSKSESESNEFRIKAVAKELFIAQGFSATSTTQIAQVVGCTQALVHYYYHTKENLFRQIFLDEVQAALDVIAESLTNDVPFDRFLTNAISLYFDTLMRNPRLPYFVLEELVSNPARRAYLREKFVKSPQYAVYYMQLDTRVRHEQAAGRMARVETFDIMMSIVSLTVFNFIALPMFKDLLERTDDQVREFILHRKNEVTRLVLAGLRP